MKITQHLENAQGKTLFSFELLPPLKGQSIQQVYDAIDPLMEFNPPFIDVTYHREDFIYKKHPTGLLEKVRYRKRPGTVAICAAIKNKYKVDAVPHLICGGFTKEETEDALLDLHFLGIDNVLVLRGDARHGETSFIPTPGGHTYASQLLQQIQNTNQGIFLHNTVEGDEKPDFCIGVAGYPEKHFEAPNLESDFKHLKEKVDLGAQFIVTQMFFDVSKYVEFVQRCRDNGIHIPIIPGLKPLTTKKQLINLPKIFHIDIPPALSNEIENCKTDATVKEAGIEWMIQQCKELIKVGAPVLHFYTMSNPMPTFKIASAIF